MRYYPQTLLFNSTSTPGFLLGYVPVTRIPFLPKDIARDMKSRTALTLVLIQKKRLFNFKKRLFNLAAAVAAA